MCILVRILFVWIWELDFSGLSHSAWIEMKFYIFFSLQKDKTDFDKLTDWNSERFLLEAYVCFLYHKINGWSVKWATNGMTSTRKSLSHAHNHKTMYTIIHIDSIFMPSNRFLFWTLKTNRNSPLSLSHLLDVCGFFCHIFCPHFRNAQKKTKKIKIRIDKLASNRNPSNVYPIKPLNQTNKQNMHISMYIFRYVVYLVVNKR